MGCDIHAIVQVRIHGEWSTRAVPFGKRNYEFFAALAGVRSDDENDTGLFGGRGLPSGFDGPYEPKENAVLVDGEHSASWCLLSEMISTPDKVPNESGARDTWDKWIELGELLARHWDVETTAVRFVFNFDN